MNSHTFIVNPAAGRGEGEKLLQLLKKELARRNINAVILETQSAGHATSLARESESPTVVAVGGDGTVNEVVNGIVGSKRTLGIIPSGSGNDLIKSIGVSKIFPQSVETLWKRRVARIDAGVVRCFSSTRTDSASNSGDRFFVNGVGVGFDAVVADRTRSIKYVGGFLRYVAAVIKTLGDYRAPLFRIKLGDEAVEGRRLLIAIGNGQCAGGGFYLTPTAKVDDGMLDICLIEDKSVTGILRLMPRVIKGSHQTFKGVEMRQAKTIIVESSDPFFVHADGEIVGRDVKRVEVEIQKSALNVIVGENFSHAG